MVTPAPRDLRPVAAVPPQRRLRGVPGAARLPRRRDGPAAHALCEALRYAAGAVRSPGEQVAAVAALVAPDADGAGQGVGGPLLAHRGGPPLQAATPSDRGRRQPTASRGGEVRHGACPCRNARTGGPVAASKAGVPRPIGPSPWTPSGARAGVGVASARTGSGTNAGVGGVRGCSPRRPWEKRAVARPCGAPKARPHSPRAGRWLRRRRRGGGLPWCRVGPGARRVPSLRRDDTTAVNDAIRRTETDKPAGSAAPTAGRPAGSAAPTVADTTRAR